MPPSAIHLLQARNSNKTTTITITITTNKQTITIAATDPPDRPPLLEGGEVPTLEGTVEEPCIKHKYKYNKLTHDSILRTACTCTIDSNNFDNINILGITANNQRVWTAGYVILKLRSATCYGNSDNVHCYYPIRECWRRPRHINKTITNILPCSIDRRIRYYVHKLMHFLVLELNLLASGVTIITELDASLVTLSGPILATWML